MHIGYIYFLYKHVTLIGLVDIHWFDILSLFLNGFVITECLYICFMLDLIIELSYNCCLYDKWQENPPNSVLLNKIHKQQSWYSLKEFFFLYLDENIRNQLVFWSVTIWQFWWACCIQQFLTKILKWSYGLNRSKTCILYFRAMTVSPTGGSTLHSLKI